MRTDAIKLEEKRLEEVSTIEDYTSIHERHRIFPEIFESRSHKKILDISAGVGIVGRRIRDNYDADLLCNDISPTCLQTMKDVGLNTISFDIDDKDKPYPLESGSFHAVISLATIEHLINIDHYLNEINRILDDNGYFYISAPNYSGIPYLIPFLLSGKTFHDPLSKADEYEFYAHIRYFTYRTLCELVSSFGFTADTVYLPIPHSSSRFKSLKKKSRSKAFIFKNCMKIAYRFSPRWASEPVVCFRKSTEIQNGKIRKVIL